jgi:hypothetical protein
MPRFLSLESKPGSICLPQELADSIKDYRNQFSYGNGKAQSKVI